MDDLSQRRIRHISSIQIRNLTAFPVRDAFASALSQPAEQPQFNPSGYFSDDLDVTLSRKRSRRISTNSIATYKSVKSEESDDHGSLDSRGRRQSRVSFHGTGGPTSGSVRFQTGSTPSIRGHRARTSSITSSLNLPSTTIPTVVPFTANLPDHSQTGLEKIIKSRLFETFLTVSVESSEPPPLSTSPTVTSLSPRSPKPNGTLTRKGTKPSPLSPAEKTARRDTIPSPSKHAPKSPSISSLLPNGKQTPQSPRKPARPSSPVLASSQARPDSPSFQSVPDYFSPIHRPSTNPSFPVDTRSWGREGHTTNPGGRKFKVELWGEVGQDVLPVLGKGKEKETQESDTDWRLIEEWTVDLGQLLLLSDEQDLPSNTLVITLQPPGQSFYLPSTLRLGRKSPTPSADAGYASDPESSGRAAKKPAGAARPISG
ncbi:hypothetical protein MIND_00436300 [Mycena indigotica]|uniref:Uncharacterized protein n=1 Tax=Mycena indigotica TaxID=2126181 RepID=A0A8H6W832_9AGAR|nr:uncharacterized protein MIND_00436300 [Mycena indigotica]KAF7306451.1 hypothetical protein MIND_00436300 [Mycena indigotica]